MNARAFLSVVIGVSLLACEEPDVATTYTTMWGDDPTDVYMPAGEGPFPIALFLQGGRVDKAEYALFATTLAEHGFVVVIPNHHRVVDFPGFQSEGLFSEQAQIADVLDFMASENSRAGSPAEGRVDASALVLLGHSYGSAASIAAVENRCQFPFCPEDGPYTRPPELRAVALTGITTRPVFGEDAVLPVHNEGMPFAIVNGELDSRARLDDAHLTLERTDDAPKGLLIVQGANHFVMCDHNNPEGASADMAEPTLDQLTGAQLAGRLAALWLLATGFDRTDARTELAALLDDDPNVAGHITFE